MVKGRSWESVRSKELLLRGVGIGSADNSHEREK